MIRIALCDDEITARDELRFGLEKILYEESEKIVYEFTSGKSAAHWLKNHPGEIDLLFLDVEMKEQNGMETAKIIRSFDENLLVVFVTGHKDYVFQGYEVGALDYVIKPPDTKKLKQILQRVRGILGKTREQMFVFKNTEGTYRFPLAQISYFYSDRRKVTAVLGGKEYPFYGKMDEVQMQAGKHFVRIHQRYLVNAQKVEHIGKDEVSVEKQVLPISRNMKADALTALAGAVLEEKL